MKLRSALLDNTYWERKGGNVKGGTQTTTHEGGASQTKFHPTEEVTTISSAENLLTLLGGYSTEHKAETALEAFKQGYDGTELFMKTVEAAVDVFKDKKEDKNPEQTSSQEKENTSSSQTGADGDHTQLTNDTLGNFVLNQHPGWDTHTSLVNGKTDTIHYYDNR